MTIDDDMDWMEAFGKVYDYFHASYEDIYSKHKNEFLQEPEGLP